MKAMGFGVPQRDGLRKIPISLIDPCEGALSEIALEPLLATIVGVELGSDS